jgi:hypothetical protein
LKDNEFVTYPTESFAWSEGDTSIFDYFDESLKMSEKIMKMFTVQFKDGW